MPSDLTLPGEIPGLLRRCSPTPLGIVTEVRADGFARLGQDIESGPCGSWMNPRLLALDLTDATGRAHAAWWCRSCREPLPYPAIAALATYRTGRPRQEAWATLRQHFAFLAHLDPNDPRALPDGSRRVDAEALRLVVLHVGVPPMTDLLFPLSLLPRVPDGAPVWVTESVDGWAAQVARKHLDLGPLSGKYRVIGHYSDSDGTFTAAIQPKYLALDLSPPPLVDGWPTRVDGADVLAGLIAHHLIEAGQPPEDCEEAAPDGWYAYATEQGDMVVIIVSDMQRWLFAADIDPTREHADRHALIAVARTVFGGGQ